MIGVLFAAAVVVGLGVMITAWAGPAGAILWALVLLVAGGGSMYT